MMFHEVEARAEMIPRTGQNDGSHASARGGRKEIDKFFNRRTVESIPLCRAVERHKQNTMVLFRDVEVRIAAAVD
jgi:hypothetical protein